jgi:hypothetical protein
VFSKSESADSDSDVRKALIFSLVFSFLQQEVISPSEVEEAKDDFPAGNGGGEWMDANDFFNNPAPAMASRFAQLAFEEASGCKRSSIIRIRTEKKGLVSRSVETFTKPALPPPMMTPRMRRPPAKTPASAIPTSTRRTSARMGIAGKNLNKTEKSFSNLAASYSVFPDLTNQQQHYNSYFCKVA